MLYNQTIAESASHEPLIIGPVPAEAPRPRHGDGERVLESFMHAAEELVKRLRQREEEFARLLQITERVNYGVVLEDVLEFVYHEMQQVIPYNRIGFSLLNSERNSVVARWARSDRPMLLTIGFEAPLEGSTLEQIIATGRPRIISDLVGYLRRKGESESTRLVVEEGMRSSLTCPLIVQGRPIGFIFFSSIDKHTYSKLHVAFFQQIAGQLAAIVEKSRLHTTLTEQNRLIEAQNAAMRADLEMARLVQRALIPPPPDLAAFDVAFVYEPAVQLGGDIVDFVPLPDGRLLLFLGDAMGHGVQAALVMSAVKAALHAAVEVNTEPQAVLAHINKTLYRLNEQFVTAACCVVDPGAKKARLSLAGHPQALWFARGDVVAHGQAALPLGVEMDSQYETAEFAFSPDDGLLIFSDGLVEAFDGRRNLYGTDRLQAIVSRAIGLSASALLAEIRRDLDVHRAQTPLGDDLTILAVRAKADQQGCRG